MVTNENEALRSRRLPVDGQPRPQIIRVCHARQPGEQVFPRSSRFVGINSVVIVAIATSYPTFIGRSGGPDRTLSVRGWRKAEVPGRRVLFP